MLEKGAYHMMSKEEENYAKGKEIEESLKSGLWA